MLGWTNSCIAFNDRELTDFQLLLGWVGSATLGKQSQRAAYKVTGANSPKGWSIQLDNEPLVIVYLMKKHKLWQRRRFDTAVNLATGIGTTSSPSARRLWRCAWGADRRVLRWSRCRLGI